MTYIVKKLKGYFFQNLLCARLHLLLGIPQVQYNTKHTQKIHTFLQVKKMQKNVPVLMLTFSTY
jgi:hypothetical protein